MITFRPLSIADYQELVGWAEPANPNNKSRLKNYFYRV